MTAYEILENTRQCLLEKNLGEALRTIDKLYHARPHLTGYQEVNSINGDFQLMMDFMAQGLDDPHRAAQYDLMLNRLYRVVHDLLVAWKCKNVGVYVAAFQKTDHLNLSKPFLRGVLEGFVSDMAMLSLEPEEQQAAKQQVISERHAMFMERLFTALFISLHWTDEDRTFYEDILISPTIDHNDQLLMVSAISLSQMNLFDSKKMSLLLNLCRRCDDTELRQRTLVGLVLSMHELAEPLFSGLAEEFRQMAVEPAVSKELVALQHQLFYCLNAEEDHQKIQKDIMPDLLKNSPVKMTRFGIIEKEEDTLENILHPDAEEKAMEKLEANIMKMYDMQRKGSDIYYGGFAQMKRHSFFNQLASWFCPYYVDHPALSKIRNDEMTHGLAENIGQYKLLCDSDKYSFVLTLSSVIRNMPKSIREILVSNPMMDSPLQDEHQESPAYLRRMYLQDLYRFFRLHPMHQDVYNPFDTSKYQDGDWRYFFFLSPVFGHREFDACKLELGRFLVKQHRFAELNDLMQTFEMADSVDFLLLSARNAQATGFLDDSIRCYQKLLELDPENLVGMKGLAKVAMVNHDYELSATWFKRLSELQPDNMYHQINYCVALVELARYDEALPLLYKMDFSDPNDQRVKRILAWTLLCSHKLEQADHIYDTLIGDNPQGDDYLNAGYVKWFMGDIRKAASMFRAFMKQEKEYDEQSPAVILLDAFGSDIRLAEDYGLSSTDLQLMAELVTRG